MTTPDNERLRQTLGQPALARLLHNLRKRLQSGHPLPAHITLSKATPVEQEAVFRLLGRRPKSASAGVRVSLAELSNLLIQAQLCSSLEQAVTELTGPLLRPDQRKESQWLVQEDNFCQRLPIMRDFVRAVAGRTYLRRLCHGHPERLPELSRCLPALYQRLPENGITLAELAAQVCGDSHAFNRGRPLGALALKLAAAAFGYDPFDPTLGRRTVWAAVGVLCDQLSTPALTLNLTATGEGFSDQALRLHTQAGQPYRLSLRQLLRQPPQISNETVFVCENPSVVAAAADQLGPHCLPLLCTEGQPKSALTALCHQLTHQGTRLVYHGDFDWPGLRIANLMIRRHQVQPWRLSTPDYLAAQARGGRLEGLPTPAYWDPNLRATTLECARSIHEEQVLERLLADLTA